MVNVGITQDGSGLREFNLLILMVLVIAGIASYVGMQLQRQRHGEQLFGYLFSSKQCRWACGIALTLLGGIGRFIVLSFTPQVLVALALGGSMIIMNFLLLMTSQNEQISKTDINGIMSILGGLFLVTWFCPSEEAYDVHELLQQFLHPIFLIYTVLVGCVVLKILETVATKDCTGQDQLRFMFIENGDKWLGRRTSAVSLYYAFISGIAGSIALLFAKCAAEILRTSLTTNNQFIHSTSYYFIAVMFCATIPQTNWMNRALRCGDSQSVFLVSQMSSIVFGVLGGILLLHEYVSYGIASVIALFISLICMSIGIYLLTQHDYLSSHKDEVYDTDIILLGASTSLLDDNDMPIATLAYPLANDEIPYVEGRYKPPAMLQYVKLDTEEEY